MFFVCTQRHRGGGALTEKLAGEYAAASFLLIGLVIVLALLAAEVFLFFLGRRRLIYCVLFNIVFAGGIVWFMLCLLLPMLWAPSVRSVEKIVLFSFLILLCVDSILKAKRQFQNRWGTETERALTIHYNVRKGTVDWSRVLRAMKLTAVLKVPGIPESMTAFISLVMILSMLAGLSLRSIFPVFSLFAWGVPACLAISIFMQLIGFGVAQIMKLIELEKRYQTRISPKH